MNLAILASGRGSNAAAILDAIAAGRMDARAAVLVCNRADAGALRAAAAHGVPHHTVLRREHPTRAAQQQRMLELLHAAGADFVALAGFTSILKPDLVAAYRGRMLNVHPSLLPAFAGGIAPEPQAAALRAGVTISGCTVHVVTDEVDAGPIVAQAAVPVLAGDTVAELSQRILAQEHRLYPRALQWFAEGRAYVDGGRLHVDSEEPRAIWPDLAR